MIARTGPSSSCLNSRFCTEVGKQGTWCWDWVISCPFLCREVSVPGGSGSWGSWRRWCHGPAVLVLVSPLLLHVSLGPGEEQGGVQQAAMTGVTESQQSRAECIQRGLLWEVGGGDSFIGIQSHTVNVYSSRLLVHSRRLCTQHHNPF